MDRRQGGARRRATVPFVTASTPDALWASRSVRHLRPGAVVCRDVRRSVRGHRLLDGASFAVPVGGRLLLVGDPPAAASLLLRILAGLARADGGSMQLAGLDSAAAGAGGWVGRIAYLGPGAVLPRWLAPREALELAARLHGYAGAERARLVDAAIARHGLDAGGGADRPMRRGGTALAERTALAAALIGAPEVLLLDDPLRAVDEDSRTRLLAAVPKRTTMVIASRLPASDAAFATRVALLRGGRVVLQAPLSALAERGLPVSTRGIEALAELMATPGTPDGRRRAAGSAAP